MPNATTMAENDTKEFENEKYCILVKLKNEKNYNLLSHGEYSKESLESELKVYSNEKTDKIILIQGEIINNLQI